MISYQQFSSALNQEKSNILWAIKEASTLVFALLRVTDTTTFTSLGHKQDDLEMKQLSMKNDTYHCLALILFVLGIFFPFYLYLMDLPFLLLLMDIMSHGHPCDSFWLVLSLIPYNLNTIPLLGSSLLKLCFVSQPTHLWML